ncbi:hypothetical protein [Sediminicurvatus halobius]|uniref:Uncharacterized protein n=1 Tax=Sediminicurvatus halobius TaxID=2182432 RepID=A0A2U2MXR3_9GAMM|nr:hypothetical protein [Spiribacter halobius]PWG61811.1 hypothetical protein DEM34_14470 [Spiribacter halobius]UEX77651.1 hypothetical protein LMH63_17240 [Spiribacter halobius]
MKVLLNSMPINRLIGIFPIRPQRAYDIIDRAYQACLGIAAERETLLRAVVSMELLSGHSFLGHLKYDARSDVTQVNEIAMLPGDPLMPDIWRRFPNY